MLFECIDRFLGHSCTLNEWRFHFRSHFDALRPLLIPAGVRSAEWCCPYNGRRQPVAADESGYHAEPSDCKCSPCVESAWVAPEELDCWKFSTTALAKHLCRELGLLWAPKKHGRATLRLGFLTHKKKRLPAYLLRRHDPHYFAGAQSLDLSQYENGLFYTPQYCAETESWFSRHRFGYFSLEDLLIPDSLSPTPVYWQQLHEFKSSITSTRSCTEPQPFIAPDYKRIVFPDGYVLNLARAHKRRAVVRFLHEQLIRSGADEFDVELMRADYNHLHPDRPWHSDRLKEDLFRNAADDFDRLFETIDSALGRFRLKL